MTSSFVGPQTQYPFGNIEEENMSFNGAQNRHTNRHSIHSSNNARVEGDEETDSFISAPDSPNQ